MPPLPFLQKDDYIIHLGEIFNSRYRVEKVLGKGSFGQVRPCTPRCHCERGVLRLASA